MTEMRPLVYERPFTQILTALCIETPRQRRRYMAMFAGSVLALTAACGTDDSQWTEGPLGHPASSSSAHSSIQPIEAASASSDPTEAGTTSRSASPVTTTHETDPTEGSVPAATPTSTPAETFTTTPAESDPSSTAQPASTSCPTGWFTLVSNEYIEKNGSRNSRPFEKPEEFPEAVCVKQPVPPAQFGDEWRIEGNTVISDVYVLDPATSPCGADLRVCLKQAPRNKEGYDDEASGGINDGHTADLQNASGRDLSEMNAKLMLRLPQTDGTFTRVVL